MEAEKLATLVNSSGFVFQLGVEELVRSQTSSLEWHVLAREYPWVSPDGNRGGFIDFVAGRYGHLRCVFECKRTQGGEWIFLVPISSQPTMELRTLWSYVAKDKACGIGWDDLRFRPSSLVSEFCIVRGASDNDRPMLERIAGDIVRASESLAREELNMKERDHGPIGYIPVIVTNATLYACRLDLDAIDLDRGVLPANATFEEVTAIRFRKATGTDISYEPETYGSLSEGLRRKERTAFVVNVSYLTEWLSMIEEQATGLESSIRPWRHLDS